MYKYNSYLLEEQKYLYKDRCYNYPKSGFQGTTTFRIDLALMMTKADLGIILGPG